MPFASLFKNSNKIIFLSLSLSLFANSYSAEVPAGAKLSQKQILNRGNGAEPPTLDPQKVEDVQGYNIAQDLFESLVRDDISGNIVPGGAEKWEKSMDGKTYTFFLRKDAKWSNGDLVTADDYVYGMQRLVDPKVASTYSFLLYDVVNGKEINEGKKQLSELGVKALDKYKLEIKLNHAIPYFLELLAMRNAAPAHKVGIEKFGDKFFQPGNIISNGPYQLKSWRIGDKLTLVKSPNFWNNKKTIIEEVNYFPTQDLNSEESMYRAGQLDITNDISADKFKKLKAELGDQIKINDFLASYYISFNTQDPVFKNNKKLRQALSMVVDRELITGSVTLRGEKPSYDIVSTGTKNYKPNKYDWTALSYEKRVAEAKKLYNEAGYSESKPLQLKILYNTNENSKKLMLSVASLWKKALGVNVSMENQEWKVFLKSRERGEFQVAWNRWIGDFNDATTFLDLLRTGNPLNSSRFANKSYDDLLQKASNEMNLVNRQKVLEDASKIAMEEYPIVPLYTAVTTHMVKSKVGGYVVKNPLDHASTFDLYILDK